MEDIILIQFGWFNSVIKKTPDMGTYNPQVGLSGRYLD